MNPLFLLQAVSFFRVLGDSMMALALPWLVLQSSGSVFFTGAVASVGLSATFLGALFSPWIMRRIGLQASILLSLGASLAGIAGLAWCFAQPTLPIVALFLFVPLDRGLDATGNIALESRFPEIARCFMVNLSSLNAIKESLALGAMTLGAAAAGALLAAAPGATTLLSAAALTLLTLLLFLPLSRLYRTTRRRFIPPPLGQTALWLWRHKKLRSLVILLLVVMASLAGLDDIVLPAYIESASGNPVHLGWILAAYAIAALISSLAYAHYAAMLHPALLIRTGVIGVALFFAGLALGLPILPMLILTFLSGLLSGALGPVIDTSFLLETPKIHRTGMLTALNLLVTGSAPLTVILYATLIDLTSVSVFGTLATGMILLTLLLPLPKK